MLKRKASAVVLKVERRLGNGTCESTSYFPWLLTLHHPCAQSGTCFLVSMNKANKCLPWNEWKLFTLTSKSNLLWARAISKFPVPQTAVKFRSMSSNLFFLTVLLASFPDRWGWQEALETVHCTSPSFIANFIQSKLQISSTLCTITCCLRGGTCPLTSKPTLIQNARAPLKVWEIFAVFAGSAPES